jgi:iSTAND domain-containing protein
MFDNIRKLIFRRLPPGTVVHDPTIADPRRFVRRVGEVIDIGAAVNRTAADVHRNADLPEWELALSLVNRVEQVGRLKDLLDDSARDGGGRAFLIIVLGSNLDCHRYFPARCANFDLKKKTGEKWDYLGTLKWSPNLSDVIGEIGRQFDVNDAHDPESLSLLLSQRDQYICFSHIVDSQHWEHDHEALKNWVAIFTENRLTVHRARFLLAFLCLQLRVPETEDCRKLRQMTKEWETAGRPASVEEGKTATRPAIIVMPELGLIKQNHLQAWPADAGRELRRNIQLGEVEIGSIFKSDAARYMHDIAAALEKPLRPQFEARPRVADTRPWA